VLVDCERSGRIDRAIHLAVDHHLVANLTEPLIETPLERTLGNCAGVNERLACSRVTGTPASGFRAENSDICILGLLQF